MHRAARGPLHLCYDFKFIVVILSNYDVFAFVLSYYNLFYYLKKKQNQNKTNSLNTKTHMSG